MSLGFDLFAAARANAAPLYERFQERCASLSAETTPRLRAFAEHIEREGRIAFNMRMSELESFLALGEHQNVYEGADLDASQSSKTRDQILREKLGAYYERRIAFDRFLGGGERLRYGALSSGGLGATAYGEFCVVLREAFAAALENLAYLSADSLRTYMLPGPMVYEEGLRRDAAPHSHRQYVAALKHASAACDEVEDRWPAVLCSGEDFVEAIFDEPPVPGNVEAVRLSQVDHEVYFHFAFEIARKELSEFDRHLVSQFKLTLNLLRKNALRLEAV